MLAVVLLLAFIMKSYIDPTDLSGISNIHGYLILASYIGALNMFSAFKLCRDSIDLIVQCLKSILIFSAIMLYFFTSFGMFFYFTNKTDFEQKESFWEPIKKIINYSFNGTELD